MGNSSKTIKCSVIQFCTMSHCKKPVQQVMPLAINALKSRGIIKKNDKKCFIKSIKGGN